MSSLDLGFSGTQLGMHAAQIATVGLLVAEAYEDGLRGHHGDCVGADAEFHVICRDIGLYMIGHPPVNNSKRAFCDFDEVREPLPYLNRNHEIVRESQRLIAASAGYANLLRSGTWATVRFAVRHGVPVVVVAPDGSILPAEMYTTATT